MAGNVARSPTKVKSSEDAAWYNGEKLAFGDQFLPGQKF